MITDVIWDLDGTISDTQHFHAEAESRLLQRYGIRLPAQDITHRYAGVKTSEFFRALLQENGHDDVDADALEAEKWDFMLASAEKGVTQIPGAVQLIYALQQAGIRQAIGSASILRYVDTVLQKLDIYGVFDAIVTGDQVAKGKPDPEIFLTAAKRMSANPLECMVIEDGQSGMLAARRAGMTCVGLVNPGDKRAYPAQYRIPSLSVLDVRTIRHANESFETNMLLPWLNDSRENNLE